MKKRACTMLAVIVVALACGSAQAVLQSFIKMQDGYFYDPASGKPWVPHGIAYQTWNRPLGVWQTTNQIDYDLDEMKKMGANSIRVDFVWKHIEEKGDNQWQWANYDYLVQACAKRDIRIFALIGYQWPPDWFQDAWYTMHPPEIDAEGIEHTNRWQSDIINYEHSSARAQYAAFFSAVCGRYATNKAIAAWIVGNEYGYLGLWSGLLDGYDPQSEQAFRTWCQAKHTNIAAANLAWGSAFTNFNQLSFPDQYRAYGVEGAIWADAVQWREDSIASFTALGARAAKLADTNHLISYSTVGMQWGEEDWRYHAEDRAKITSACAATNAALGFFSINNYPWSILGHESQNGHWGVSFTKKVAGIPVLYTETGFSSSESMWPGMNEFRQGPLVRNALWEGLEAGAIGTHIFSWMDRPWITDREKGFGVVYADRNIKPAYWVSRDAYNLMEQVKIQEVLAGSKDPKPDIAFLWTPANDSQYNRYECEMQQMAGALERLGYEPNFMDLNELGSGAFTNYRVIILPRNMRVEDVVPNSTNKTVLEFLRTVVLPKGIHVLASADLPGLQDFNGKARTNFVQEVRNLFGVDASDIGGFEAPMRRREYVSWYWTPIQVKFTTNAIGSVAGGYTYRPEIWKYSDEIKVTNGGVLWAEMDGLRNKGFEESNTSVVKWDGTWGNIVVRNNWGWQYDGTNMVQMWGDSGMWEDLPVVPFGRYTFGAFLRSNSDDPLRTGAYAVVQIEWRDQSNNVLGVAESARLTNATPANSWVQYKVDAIAPPSAWTGRQIIRSGSTTTNGAGAVYVDARRWAPAVVVKNHGAGKSAIFLYSVGDNKPDGNADGQMDTIPWKYRYDVLGALVRDYFGIQPAIKATGTNAYLCLPEYRTCTNGAILMQVKNYSYNTNYPASWTNLGGGAPLTFTINSSMLTGRTIRAFEQSKIIETNSDGVFNITLQPDGQDMLLAYFPGTNRTEIVQIADAPAVVHPFGDKAYQVRVKYDCRGTTGLKLKAAFKEDGDNGDGTANEIYQILTNAVSGAGETNFWMWIPDANQRDPDYISTPDGGNYQFAAWLENGGGTKVSEAVPQPTRLEWGVRPITALPTNLTKGGSSSITFEWENLYEQLFWQITPMTRNSSYPSRVAVFRSSKTEAQFPGHFTRANAAADWLNSLGYTNGNPLDILFDNVTVNGSFSGNFESGSLAGWTRAAGCANWAVSTAPTPTTSGTVGYWKCDETAWSGVSNDVRDASGKANHGRAYNGANTTNDARLGRAGWFDGTNDYVEITNSATLQANRNLTLSFWIKPWNLGAARLNPLDKSYGGEFALTIETNRSLSFYQGSDRVSGKYIGWTGLPAGSLANGTWQHVVITRDANTRTLRSYLNGAFRSSTTYANDTNTLPAKSAYPVRIALGYTGYGLGGVMDEVKISTNLWAANDVYNEYRAGTGTRALRAWRIGNSDNILLYTNAVFTNATISADIRYTKQDNYFNDAEVLFRYQNRDNFYKVGIRNYYGFWRLKYTVRARTNIVQQGWLCDFPKTNRPMENMWYNLKIESYGSTNKVYFNGQYAGTFWATNFASGRIGVGSSAQQLGTWEPAKGYFFIDDDEYSFWAPEGQPQVSGKPLNLDWGYLRGFFGTLVLPSVYVMSDIEVSNVCTWVTNGLYSLIATDGGTAMRKETGASGLGRIEKLFGVAAATRGMSGINRVVLGSDDHYVKLDYAPGAQISATGTAWAWSTLTSGKGVGTVYTASNNSPALVCNTITNNPAAPGKAFCFNWAADTAGQLTDSARARTVARRAFEWARGQAYRVRLELKYMVNPAWPDGDLIIAATNGWLLTGSGTSTLTLNIPTDGIMTGSNVYWVMYVYPWDSAYPWGDHAGFYSSANDGFMARLAGKGLQIAGITPNAYAGRAWDMWAGYNTEGQAVQIVFGIKDKGRVNDEDNFNDGDYNGWSVQANPNIAWSVTNGALRATVVSTGGYASIYRDNLGLGITNITFEYSTRFMNGAKDGGAVYRGRVLYVNPQLCGWADSSPLYYTNNTGVTTGKWQYVVLHVRDGAPYMRSDLYVDGKVVFLDEPIEVAGYTTNTVGFLSPYSPSGSYVEWDNTRVVDEQYSFATQTVTGVLVPSTNGAAFWPFIPDYDPNRWEHEGATLGGRYEWYVYMRGEGVHAYSNVNVYFAPRLRVEEANFPTTMNPGQAVNVPVEWENLPTNLPRTKLCIAFQDAWTGIIYANKQFDVTNLTGSGSFPVTLPYNLPAGDGYLWTAYLYPTNAADPWNERIGADDTFRHGPDGIGVEPETRVTVSSVLGSDYMVYRDLGIPPVCDVYTWHGGSATFDGSFTGETPPEGTKCFRTATPNWAGWGVFRLSGSVDMSEYANGLLRFWLKSTMTVKVEIEQLSGVKATRFVGSTSNLWREIVIPVSDFAGVNLTQIRGLFLITSDTAQTFFVDYVRWTKGILYVYNDAGIPERCNVFTWAGGPATFNGDFTGGAAPEGSKCFLTTGSTWAGWGVMSTNGTMDLRLYSNGFLRFWTRSTRPLKIELEGPQGTKRQFNVTSTTNTWREVTVPLTTFNGVNWGQMYGLFAATAETGTTFYIDDARWIRGTNAVPSERKEVFYSDAGIPAGTDVYVWWASQYWAHVSMATNDGGFESSAAGAFPNSGFWNLSIAGAGATAQCSTAAIYTGAKGLRAQSGSAGASFWVSTYQEREAYAGDIWRADVYARQPVGSTWVTGSTAFVRLNFLDAWRQPLSNRVSATKVTTAGQNWTLCSVSDMTAPFGTRYVRMELVVQKPNGATGVSVADFDDSLLRQANSFNGSFTEDPNTPEGTKVFRAYCVNWSGWGIFYTNSVTVTNLTAFTNGYLKFWLRSSGTTKVEIQSVYNGATNTAIGAWYGRTTNQVGEVVWQHKVIPASAFNGVVFSHIKSPFMVTDPTYDRSYAVDYVRWELVP